VPFWPNQLISYKEDTNMTVNILMYRLLSGIIRPNEVDGKPFYFISFNSAYNKCLQCFEAVGWVAGRASCLQKTEWWDAGMVILSGGEVQICIWPS